LTDPSLLRSIERAFDLLSDDSQYGDPIAKRLIPIEVQNLYRIELAHFWRMLYTIESDGNDITIFVLFIVDHKEYDRLFGYGRYFHAMYINTQHTQSPMKKIIGWITASITFIIIALWSYWGINEAFHEGWYHTSIFQNISLTFIQYLSIPLIFLVLALIAIQYRRIGSALFIAVGIFALFFFDSPAGRVVIFIPLLLLAFGFYYGKFRKIASKAFITIFLLIILSFGIPQLIRVENRFNDNDFGERIISNLTWAAQGSGFPLVGTDWKTARDNCIGPWRLPSRDELVSSMTRNNENAGGYMDASGDPHYETTPDKETPLWNPHSQIIYYWTSESIDNKAYLVAYNGKILARSSGADYQGYRCVKSLSSS